MTNRLIALAVLLGCTTSLLAEEPRLANAARVFPASQPAYKRSNQYHVFAIRLSPDGKQLLYSRPVAGSKQSDDESARYELVLRELGGGKEVVLPIEPLDSGWRSVPTRFNTFDPTGRRLVLMNIKVETQRNMNWTVYDVGRSKATDTTWKSTTMGPAKFTADGQALLLTVANSHGDLVTEIISLKDPKAKPKLLTTPGWVQSVSPVGDVAAFFVPPEWHVHAPQPDNQMQRPAARLVLWDLKADEKLVQVPTHPRNRQLDDLETQWTSDGRYLYYVDGEEGVVEGQADRPTYRSVTRIWDRRASKPAGTIPDVMPLGPGPGASTMVLSGGLARDASGGFILHDAATGKDYPIGDIAKKLIHASGKKVIYAEKSGDSAAEEVFSADLILPQPRHKS